MIKIFVIIDELANRISDPIIVQNDEVFKRQLRNLPDNSTYHMNPKDFSVVCVGQWSYDNLSDLKLFNVSDSDFSSSPLLDFIGGFAK